MSSLKQYIDLYNENKLVFDQSPYAISQLRNHAIDFLARYIQKPSKEHVAYPELATEYFFAPDYGLNINRMQFAVDIAASFKCDVPNISTLLAVVVNDTFRPTALLEKNLPQGVTVCSLAHIAKTKPEWTSKYLNVLADDSTAASALNTLLLQDGVVIHISKGVKLDKPIQIVNIFNSTAPLMASRRILVVAEEDSSAKVLICDHSQLRDVEYLSDEVIEIFAEKGSNIEIYDIEESTTTTRRIRQVFCRQEAESAFTMMANTLSGGISINDFHVSSIGDNTHTHLGGLVIGALKQIVENKVNLVHDSRHSTSDQLFKYALFEESRGAFGGKIIVAEGAEFTDASQSNRNLLASDNARMATAPQLEIYCEEVKCSHGATTGQLDERALFYMQTRGIPQEEAKLMLTQAFMADVIESISFDIIRERLRFLVEKRLCGASATCSTGECSGCKTSNVN